MTWIQTYTGRQFFPLQPRAEDVDIYDIAHSLAFLCRFNGHCEIFYSVAEHCLRVSQILKPTLQLWGLLHDAAEAYLSDVPRPIKSAVPSFEHIENQLLELIAAKYRLEWPIPSSVRRADDILLATEARDLVTTPPASWGLSEAPLEKRIVPLSPARAKQMFLERFAALTHS